MVSENGRGKHKLNILRRAIIEVARIKRFTRKQYYKISSYEIQVWLKDNDHDGIFTPSEISKIRLKLPKQYRTKLW